ncbi:transglycosylase domain-containing protein [Salibacterium halotolerans]|uniref:Penicillin-binding protein n=1 Tax=Salibacterium halotolerans TaxID=1884432 RepID=A0A1I5VJY2_9BACI|nr:transglycosylase domain-containing protein [Salibacterium halotolerans]SFQ07617.1 penicillin-binding protein [Salibacterium halotolerans]
MKNFLGNLNERFDSWKNKPVIKGLNITSYVFWNLLLVAFVVFIALGLFAGGAGAGYFMSLVENQEAYSKEEFENQVYNYEEISGIYFDEGEFLGEIPARLERKERPLEEMSDHLIHAVISTEDEYFYEHEGIVPKALLRAVYQEVSNASNQTGGSTLTQQVVKNQILTNEVSFERKAKEIALALRMENYFEKDSILEAYLNIVPFGRNSDGRNIAGAQSAAEGIFGVDVSELNPAQAAFIAGLPQNPYIYTPFAQGGKVKSDMEEGLARMERVLGNMRENDFLTEEEYQNALDYDIRANLAEPQGSIVENYPYLTYETQRRAVDIIRNDLMNKAGVNLDSMNEEERRETIGQYQAQAENELALGGYNVHITVKKNIYDAMQEAASNSQWYGPDREVEGNVEQEQVGAMMIDNQNGAILSFVGGRNFEQNNLNHATQAYRQNGSTIKPLLDYGPAMEQGLVQPGTILPDVPGEYENGEDSYQNYGDSYQGFVSVREGLVESRNSPAVRTFERMEKETARQALLDLGFNNIGPNEPYPSAAIGGLTNGTTVETNTNAYAAFGNNGTYNDSYMIQRIETKDGETIYEHQTQSKEVFSPQTTFLTVDILRDVLGSGGTASALPGMMNFGGDWAGKTGTTDDTHDSWFVGFNPNVTFGIWIGYDTPQEVANYYKGLSYGTRTQQIWADYMNAAYQAEQESEESVFGLNDRFQQPDGIVRQTICGITGKLPTSECSNAGFTTTDYFNEQYVPTETGDGLQQELFVTINGARYQAYDSTPSAFTRSGISVDDDLFDTEGISEYLPEEWQNVAPDRQAPDNGRAPSPVANVSFSGNQVTWSPHRDGDIVGYRIYRSNGELVGSIRADGTTSFNAGSGSYFVTAVDSRGRESSQSATAQRYVNTNDGDKENDDNGSTTENSGEPTEEDNNNEESQDSGSEDSNGSEETQDNNTDNNNDQNGGNNSSEGADQEESSNQNDGNNSSSESGESGSGNSSGDNNNETES